MKLARTIAAVAAPLALGGVLLATAGQASAAVTSPVRPAVASGSVELGSPLQYEKFTALQGLGHNRGSVNYTNWTYADPGSRTWAPAQSSPGTTAPEALTFTFNGTPYAHTLNGGLKLTALSPETLAFSGTGQYPAAPATAQDSWTIQGTISHGKVHAVISYDGSAYQVTMDGVIAPDGSASGTAVAVSPAQNLTWAMPKGSFTEELHFVAPVRSDQIQRHDATFGFTVPAGSNIAGTKVTVQVHDGGRGPAHDSYAHGVTGGPLTAYPIIGGPGVTVITLGR